jgi:hypothetical protein
VKAFRWLAGRKGSSARGFLASSRAVKKSVRVIVGMY